MPETLVPLPPRPTSVAPAKPRLRAFLVGIPFLLFVCLLSVYADMVSKVVQFGVLQFAPPAIAALFAIAGANQLLKRFSKREFLSGADLLVIYAMMLTGVLVSTRGVVEKLIPPLAALPYFATRENGWHQTLIQHMPSWAVPYVPSATFSSPPAQIAAFYEGLAPGQSIPWNAWIGPLAAWFSLVLAVIWCFLCLSAILRKQWAENEQLRFPLTTLPLAVIKNEVEGQPFWSNRAMWMGFAFAFIYFGINGLSVNFPDVPKLMSDMALGPYFSERPFNQMDYTAIWFSLAAVGFLYFLPTDLLFSLWFFFVLSRMQDVGAVILGGQPTGIGTHNARVFTGYQAAGAYVVLILAQLRIGWPHYKAVLQTAFGHRTLDDSEEILPYRVAFWGLVAGFGFIVAWLSVAGMNPTLAIAQMGIYIFLLAMIMSRGVAEGGLLMTETSFLPSHLIRLVAPLSSFSPASLTMLGTTDIMFARDMRGVLLSSFLDNQKLAGDLKVKPRALLFPLGFAVIFAMVISSAFFLYLSYSQGALSHYSYPINNARNIYNATAANINGSGFVPDATAWGGFGVGIVVTAALTWARAQFSWFPLHPLGYALAPTWAMVVLWFPALVAWALKGGILRFGGIETYRKVAPFMLGLIGGEFLSAVFWALGNIARGWNAPSFPWP